MNRLRLSLVLLLAVAANPLFAGDYPDRFVWIFGWNLNQDRDVQEISPVLDTAGKHGLNGAVVSLGLDTLCKKPPEFFQRLEQVKQVCERNGLEMIPSVFSVGYGGSILAHDRNLAEGLPVIDAPFVVEGNEARFVPEKSVAITNGDFENFKENRLVGFNLQDRPGEVSFRDEDVKHEGKASLRLEKFLPTPPGNGRVMQTVKVRPHRMYRLSLWVKTDGLEPAGAFRMQILAGKRNLSPQSFHLQSTTDWRHLTLVFNSLEFVSVNIYAGLWGAKSGKVWLDDWRLEEVGPMNVLHRPGTPGTVRSEDGSVTFVEGRDYERLEDRSYNLQKLDRPWAALHLPAGSRIKDGDRLRVSWYHALAINDSQVTVCMAEPALYEMFEHEAKLLAEHVRPKRILLNMDEVRMGGTCRACGGRDLGELFGECVTRQAQILRKHIPGVKVYVWSDMLDPSHNAHGDYYLARGDFTGSWNNVPKDLIISVWGGDPREQSLRFFSERGFETLVACYYDADDLNGVKGWIQTGRGLSGMRGFMYTPWQGKYALLPEFGDLIAPGKAQER